MNAKFTPNKLSETIIAEGDTGVGRFFCAYCGCAFRALLARVTTINKLPLCKQHAQEAAELRASMGLPIVTDPSAYLADNDHSNSCPKCGSFDISKRHSEGSFRLPECNFMSCDNCEHQWNHS